MAALKTLMRSLRIGSTVLTTHARLLSLHRSYLCTTAESTSAINAESKTTKWKGKSEKVKWEDLNGSFSSGDSDQILDFLNFETEAKIAKIRGFNREKAFNFLCAKDEAGGYLETLQDAGKILSKSPQRAKGIFHSILALQNPDAAIQEEEETEESRGKSTRSRFDPSPSSDLIQEIHKVVSVTFDFETVRWARVDLTKHEFVDSGSVSYTNSLLKNNQWKKMELGSVLYPVLEESLNQVPDADCYVLEYRRYKFVNNPPLVTGLMAHRLMTGIAFAILKERLKRKEKQGWVCTVDADSVRKYFNLKTDLGDDDCRTFVTKLLTGERLPSGKTLSDCGTSPDLNSIDGSKEAGRAHLTGITALQAVMFYDVFAEVK